MGVKDDKGFTLLELIIGIVIAAIVMTAILGFMLTGFRSYQSANEEVNLQVESQYIMNQLEDLILEANYVSASPDKISIYQAKSIYEITFLNHKIYLQVRDLETNTLGEKSLFGKYVETLEVDTSNLKRSELVSLILIMKNGKKSYTVSNQIHLRNHIEEPVN